MKVTQRQLKQIIAEELQRELNEGPLEEVDAPLERSPQGGPHDLLGREIYQMRRKWMPIIGIRFGQLGELLPAQREGLEIALEEMRDAVSKAKSCADLMKMILKK